MRNNRLPADTQRGLHATYSNVKELSLLDMPMRFYSPIYAPDPLLEAALNAYEQQV